MTRRALVTGATGFIGGCLSRRLTDAGWTVHALVRNPDALLPPGVIAQTYAGATGEVADAVARARPDVVLHLASLYLADHRPDQIEALVAANVLLTAQLGEAASAAGVPLLNTGTGWQHADGPGFNPVNLYAATKQAGVDLLRFYAEARHLRVLTLKLFDTYGLGDTRRKLVQLLVEAALSGQALGMSGGEQRIDLTHVDDVVSAFTVAVDRLLAGAGDDQEEFFVRGDRLSVRALAARVGDALGRPVPARFGERPYRPREVMEPTPGDPVLPGWKPQMELNKGIQLLAAARR